MTDRPGASLADPMAGHGIAPPRQSPRRVLVGLSGAPGGGVLIRRAAILARRADAELIGVHVRAQNGLGIEDPARLEGDRRLLESLGGVFDEIVGSDVPRALLQTAQAEQVDQIVLGASRRSRLSQTLRGSVINTVIRRAGPIDVHVVSPRRPEGEATVEAPRPRTRLAAVPPRRRTLGFIVGLGGLATLTAVLYGIRDDVEFASVLLLYLAVTVAAAAIGGMWPGTATAAGGFLLADWFHTEPFFTLTIADPTIVVALIVFAIVAGVVSMLVDIAARRAAEASRAGAESAALVRLAGALLDTPDPLPRLVHDLRTTFGLAAAAILRRSGETWTVEVADGGPVPSTPAEASDSVPVSENRTLVLCGRPPPAGDRRLLAAFTAQLAAAVARQELQAKAAAAAALEQTDRLRTALLGAVSHDLRTPLASIKASATSLLQRDVDWGPDTTLEFLDAIVRDADRLNALVGNLLDMSRLQAGALQLSCRPIGLDDVLPGALDGFADDAPIDIDVPETLPYVLGDPGLLERVVANLVDNALKWSPEGQAVQVRAGEARGGVELRVTDRGPGIPAHARHKIFQPFQRLGDADRSGGVGLGLAVSRGFVEAMGGKLTVDDTPGGGATMVVTLKAAP